MDHFMESGDLEKAVPNLELPKGNTDALVDNAMEEIGQQADLNEGDASWLETLVQRMVSPIVDVFEGSENGCETERIAPSDVQEQAEEGIEAHDIEEAAEQWHVQDGDYSCAVCTQQFIINEFMDLDVSEEQLCTIAEENGWFEPEAGTAPADIGNLLELYGIDTQTNYEGSIEEIKSTLDQGGRVIVAVDSMVLWVDGFGNYPVYGMDHAIEVIGIDDSDPLDVRVIINDSGIEGGCGQSVPYRELMEAWAPSGGFMVSACPNT